MVVVVKLCVDFSALRRHHCHMTSHLVHPSSVAVIQFKGCSLVFFVCFEIHGCKIFQFEPNTCNTRSLKAPRVGFPVPVRTLGWSARHCVKEVVAVQVQIPQKAAAAELEQEMCLIAPPLATLETLSARMKKGFQRVVQVEAPPPLCSSCSVSCLF